MRRRPGAQSVSKPVAHGSSIASEKSSTPRLRTASCQRGSCRVTSSAAKNSSSMMLGWTPSIGVHDCTVPAVSDTTLSTVRDAARS